MPIPLSKIAAYYRACYQADFRALHLLNFFSKKVEHARLLEDAALLTGKMEEVPIDSEWAQKVDRFLDIYSKEKSLYCAAFFLLGRSRLLGRNQMVCAPLLIYPLELIEKKSIYYLRIDLNSPVLNPAVVECLNRSAENLSATQEALAQGIPVGELNFEAFFRLEATFTDLFPNVDVSSFNRFPELTGREAIDEALKKARNSFILTSAAGIGVVDKGRGTRGVINELELLIHSNDWSQPLRHLFSDRETIAPIGSSQEIWAPATFSRAQEQVVQNAYRFPLSLVIGPPGTGKTFTIASLAVDLMSKGQSVLIASRNNQAVKVVAEKIESDLGLPEIVVKATSGNYRKAVKQRLQEWYKGIGWEHQRESDVRLAYHEIRRQDKEIRRRENEIRQWEDRMKNWGQTVVSEEEGLWMQLKRWYIQRRMQKAPPFWQLIFELEKCYRSRQKLLLEYLRIKFYFQLRQVLYSKRWVVRKLVSALSARTGNIKDSRFENMDFSVMLQCMPIWITNTTEAHQMLPGYTELFDVVIIDEASQCDIASALPLLQRAKRAVIVGDPKQLRHLSFVSEQQQQLFRKQLGLEAVPDFWLDYRNRSLLDLVSDQLPSQEQVQLLDEHFRSLPDIIAFSNRHFYRDQLRIMTATPTTRHEQNLFLWEVPGRRTEQGHNEEEAIAVLKKIEHVLQEESTLEAALCQSIGVLSPFRAQAEHLQTAILRQFSNEQLSRHRILVGTPFAFQGEERDIMLLSFALHPDSPAGVWSYLNREDVFNVSITRARVQQHIFLSGKPQDFPDGNMLRAYLDFIHLRQAERRPKQGKPAVFDRFMSDVADHLKSWGITEIYDHYSIGGLVLDLVVVQNGRTYCIDLVGYPGPHIGLLPISHWKILSRVGVQVFALPFVNWYFQPQIAQRALQQYLSINRKSDEVHTGI